MGTNGKTPSIHPGAIAAVIALLTQAERQSLYDLALYLLDGYRRFRNIDLLDDPPHIIQ